tara:strand:- start:2944 stop:3141 length:198 start_codon:yes stop_codon:yes gene_type:complete
VALGVHWRKRIAPEFSCPSKYVCFHAKNFQRPRATVTQKAQSAMNILLSLGTAPVNAMMQINAAN